MWCLVSVDARLGVNVALNRPSYQVSTFDWHDAMYANDGGHGIYWEGGPCAGTGIAINPWWAVDLGVQLKVHSIQFTNRNAAGAYYMQSVPI